MQYLFKLISLSIQSFQSLVKRSLFALNCTEEFYFKVYIKLTSSYELPNHIKCLHTLKNGAK